MAKKVWDPDVQREYPIGEALVWAALIPVFVGSWWSSAGGFFWPVFPVGLWGLALGREVQKVYAHNQQVEARRAAALPAPAPALPEPVSPLAGEVQRLAAVLRTSGREPLARGLEAGLAETVRLGELRAQLGPVEAAVGEARAEASRLGEQASRAADDEARQTWERAAEAATRRAEKLEVLRGAEDRIAARIASFEQTVKSLAVDLTRVEFTTADGTGTVEAAAELAGRVDREVEALHRTNEELRTLAAARRQVAG